MEYNINNVSKTNIVLNAYFKNLSISPIFLINSYFQIYKLIGNINCKYKVGIKSLLSNKFYNIQYKIDNNGYNSS